MEPMSHRNGDRSSKHHYLMLGLNLLISAGVMYLAMFSMIDGLNDFYNNLNMLYMVLIMVAPMGILMLLTMSSMYSNVKLNIGLYVLFVALLVAGFGWTRSQAMIGDSEFLRSMIPHHSGAILMCREAKITDPEIKDLCKSIMRSQNDEIGEMKRILHRLVTQP